MGVDFLRRTAPSFNRALDKRLVALRTPDLLTPRIDSLPRLARATLSANAELSEGQQVLVREIGEQLVIQTENAVVGKFENPPAEFVAHVRKGGGIEIGQVDTIHQLSGSAEVFIGNR